MRPCSLPYRIQPPPPLAKPASWSATDEVLNSLDNVMFVDVSWFS
jgi:hypothetical protein